MDDITCSSWRDWVLKGEGGANAVFGYLGNEPHLVRAQTVYARLAVFYNMVCFIDPDHAARVRSADGLHIAP